MIVKRVVDTDDSYLANMRQKAQRNKLTHLHYLIPMKNGNIQQ